MPQRSPAIRLRTALTSAVLLTTALAFPAASSAMQTDGDPPPDSETAPPAVAERCDHANARQFDFWLGEWEVRTPDGELLGHNEIERIAQGCGLLERWRSAGGGRGTSVNTYDTDRGAWTQRWIGSDATLWLEGGFEEGSMVLIGTAPRSTPRGPVLDRLTWTPLVDGRVRQVWEVSRDGGETWERVFEGLYGRIRSATQSTIHRGISGRTADMAASHRPVSRLRKLVMAGTTRSGRSVIALFPAPGLTSGTVRSPESPSRLSPENDPGGR